MEMRNIILDGAKFPLDTDNTQAYYRVKDNGNGTSTASYLMQFRGKPAFMTGMMKGSFKKTLANNLKGLKHYVETGEQVTPFNNKMILFVGDDLNSAVPVVFEDIATRRGNNAAAACNITHAQLLQSQRID